MAIKPAKQLVDEANAIVDTWTVEMALDKSSSDDVQFVDIRDIRELQRDGTIPGSYHAPRGMLEFWFDPASPYAKDVFQQSRTYLLFCASGWRSALAAKTLKDMGVDNVAHLGDGLNDWKAKGHPIERLDRKKT